MQAPTVTDEEAVVETLEPEIEAEEIVLQTPAYEDDEIVTQAAELEAEEIEFEALDPEFDAQEVTAEPQAVEVGIDAVESVATDEVVKSEKEDRRPGGLP